MYKRTDTINVGVQMCRGAHARLRELARQQAAEQHIDVTISELIRSAITRCYGIEAPCAPKDR